MADPSTLASDLRAGVADLSSLAAADLAILWREVSRPGEMRDALMDVLPALIATYGAAAATLAADWYDEARGASAAPGRFTAIATDLGDTETDSLARWALSPAFAAAPDWRRAQVLVEGGVQKRIANAARYTVAESSVMDPGASGWQRVGDGNSCAFCAMLIGRGSVYEESTAQFASHEFCGCSAVPAFKGQPLPVEPTPVGKYIPTTRTVTDADKARVKRWIADNL